ncbi:uncharacterized protein MYCGRDRAFT_93623 [Zymoseptoria tritici IPO323]|uniref:SnoaL-like domain-containing protein n=1 Tax=Zymoseptoria tritici (strain CBS 115943 / IPO323) TaxID=336722 RepID=F9XE44_ZYMTI|nr:uncharacterized protein MYCGRDRAFT_93623 [Zymoseptoria tritici IPO323]EGP86972.1 hypothetical protein MYCGRDRAFT_93623 [Zymoseptoria tritici IPO323]
MIAFAYSNPATTLLTADFMSQALGIFRPVYPIEVDAIQAVLEPYLRPRGSKHGTRVQKGRVAGAHRTFKHLPTITMPSLRVLTAVLLTSILATATPVPDLSTRQSCSNKISITAVMENWAKIWKGDTSDALLKATIMPDILIQTDRLPYGPDYTKQKTEMLNVHNEEQLLAFVKESRKGYSSYGAVNNYAFANSDGTRLVTRWTVNAVIGSDNPSPIRKAGDRISFDGTDLVAFDPCSGKIQTVQTAQDTLNFAYQLGMNIFA